MSDQTRVQTEELIYKEHRGHGDTWLEAGPDVQDGIEMAKGPLVSTDWIRCKNELKVDTKAQKRDENEFDKEVPAKTRETKKK